MKNFLLKTFTLIVLGFCSCPVFGFDAWRAFEYVPIDSITKNDIFSNFIIDLKNKEIVLFINGDSLLFKQTYDYNTDSIHYFPPIPPLIAIANEKEEMHLRTNKLISFSDDSIYLSANYQKFDIVKRYNTSKIYTVELSIHKNELKGLLLPTKTANRDSMFYRRFEHYKQIQLTAGYTIIPKMKDIVSRTNHAFEIGIAKSNVARYIESASSCYYLSNEFLFNSDHFSIGPKMGANFIIWAFGLGTELVYYTDFHENTLHWVAYMGVGLGAGNLRMGVHVPVYNRHFQDISRISIGLTLPFCTLSKKNIDLKQ
jgi:hypothetical protein